MGEVEPGDVQVLFVGGEPVAALGEDAAGDAVGPGADHQFGAGDRGGILQRARQEDVVPAGDVQYRHLDRGIGFTRRGPAPVRIAGRVGEPLLVIGREPVEEFRRLPGIAVERVDAVDGFGDFPFGRGIESGSGEQQIVEHPVEDESELEGAALVRPALVESGAGHVRGDRTQGGWPFHGREQGGHPFVGAPEQARRAVAPGLRRRPGHGVGAVRGLVQIGLEGAAGRKSAADVLHQQGVSGARHAQAVQGSAAGISGFPVGSSPDEYRNGSGNILREIEIGAQ